MRKIKAGDRSVYPHNTAFTDQERKVFQIIEHLTSTLRTLKTELAQTPQHACLPPETYDPDEMAEIREIEDNLGRLDQLLRWLPGGAYRYE